jgi:predicted phosphodiesterase
MSPSLSIVIMKIHFDLISDLHVDTWDEEFSWEGKATSLYAVVAGDISRDRSQLRPVLEEISKHYVMTMFVDGNDEHRWTLDNLAESYKTLKKELAGIPNFIWLQDDSLVIDNIGFIGTNGWTSFDFAEDNSYLENKKWMEQTYKISMFAGQQIEAMAMQDAGFLVKTVEKLQRHPDVKKIVVVTHFVPNVNLINHDIQLVNQPSRLNTTGNSFLSRCLEEDHEQKIDTWCFGHYHSDVDRVLNGVRYVNNCRGRGGTNWCKPVYYPKRIEVGV